MTIAVADVEALIRQGMQAINAQNAVAMTAHQRVERACPEGQGCTPARDAARTDDALARGRIAAEQVTLNAAAGLLVNLNAQYALAVRAEAQAAAQVANGINSDHAVMDYGEILHAASDAAGLVVSLAVAEVNPLAAVTGVVTVVGEIVGVAGNGPDADALILQGLQGVSQQPRPSRSPRHCSSRAWMYGSSASPATSACSPTGSAPSSPTCAPRSATWARR